MQVWRWTDNSVWSLDNLNTNPQTHKPITKQTRFLLSTPAVETNNKLTQNRCAHKYTTLPASSSRQPRYCPQSWQTGTVQVLYNQKNNMKMTEALVVKCHFQILK